jgi:hypothetical protein
LSLEFALAKANIPRDNATRKMDIASKETTMPDSNPSQGGRTQYLEFILVVVMLGILLVLVMSVLLIPTSWKDPPVLPKNANAEQVLKYQQEILAYQKSSYDYRKDVLSIILTAFGAWVGAGAAYFFGRESLRDANTLLRMTC